jgi:magnesium chelatase subunit D
VGKRVSTFVSETRGRPVGLKIPREYPRGNLAFLPSLLAGVLRKGLRFPLRLELQDLRVWLREGKAPLTIVLIADVSASTVHFLEHTAKIISILYRDAYRKRDRLGLVAIVDGKVQIVNHPSRNLQVVLGNLTRLKPSGHTPLAEALDLALEVFKQETLRQPIYNPLAVLLSDCHPEPVSGTRENLMEEPVYKRVMSTARLFRAHKVPVIVINPAHGRFKSGILWWGTRLAIEVAALSGGKYYGIPEKRYRSPKDPIQRFMKRRYFEVDAKNIHRILMDYRDRPSDLLTQR